MDNAEHDSGMTFDEACNRFMDIFDEPDSRVQPVGIKLIRKGQEIPAGTRSPEEYQGVPWCEAVRIAAMDGEVVVIDKENVGCPAAAIALGLVDQYQGEPLFGTRKYTDMMETTASPADFTSGTVYGCKASDNMQFALFGEGDTGRYETLDAAKNAVAGMTSIQPDIMDAAVAYPAGTLGVAPDVVILGLLPKQVLLAIQGYNFLTGNRFLMSTIGIRAVCADLTALPFLEQRLNGSFFCLGARAVGGWEGDLLGLGMPLSVFERMVTGMERSAGGFPYKAYP
ncbi:MAG: hypothetical protein C5S49_01135 [Candidatus Methanogaster sp.]|nr:MAG: hypothetical protein C5S49_01135 [ANME-2 cluster archaeon]